MMVNKTAIGFLTKDRVELSKRTVEPLLSAPVDLHWFDGSTTDEGNDLPNKYVAYRWWSVQGGPDAAVAFALTTMLDHPNNYEYIGLCENDVLLSQGWYDQTFHLFSSPFFGDDAIGAVSARTYVDRVLFQRVGHAVMHGLGWGMQVLTRRAAELSLRYMRTSHSSENRRTFAKLAAIDIGKWWAFGSTDTWLCADWGNDRILASHGLASLGLVASPVQMIGQNPPLAQQQLQIAETPVELLRNDKAFNRYTDNLSAIRNGLWSTNSPSFGEYHDVGNNTWTYFAHHVPSLGGKYTGEWRLRFLQGFGPFAWEASSQKEHYQLYKFPTLDVAAIGTVDFICSGGLDGGQVRVRDHASGYECSPSIPPESVNPQVTHVTAPAGIAFRQLTFEALTPGIAFYGIRAREAQPVFPKVRFTHATLPPVGE